MRIVANAHKPPVIIPIVVVAVDIHVALVIPTVERGIALYRESSTPPPLEPSSSRGAG